MHVSMYVCMYVCLYIYIYIYICIDDDDGDLWDCGEQLTGSIDRKQVLCCFVLFCIVSYVLYTPRHTYTQRDTHVRICMYVYIRIYTHAHMHIHTYIHTYLHTYIHTHTHTHTPGLAFATYVEDRTDCTYVCIYMYVYIHMWSDDHNREA